VKLRRWSTSFICTEKEKCFVVVVVVFLSGISDIHLKEEMKNSFCNYLGKSMAGMLLFLLDSKGRTRRCLIKPLRRSLGHQTGGPRRAGDVLSSVVIFSQTEVETEAQPSCWRACDLQLLMLRYIFIFIVDCNKNTHSSNFQKEIFSAHYFGREVKRIDPDVCFYVQEINMKDQTPPIVMT